eukprot:1656730-Lingulodinium_polyedra.AAC.1
MPLRRHHPQYGLDMLLFRVALRSRGPGAGAKGDHGIAEEALQSSGKGGGDLIGRVVYVKDLVETCKGMARIGRRTA